VKISEVAKQIGLNAKTIRYYERIGLVDMPPRLDNGYREYADEHVQQLWFLRHARQFGGFCGMLGSLVFQSMSVVNY